MRHLPPVPDTRFDNVLEDDVKGGRRHCADNECANEQFWEIVPIPARCEQEADNKSRRYSGRKQGPEATATKQVLLQQTRRYATKPTAQQAAQFAEPAASWTTTPLGDIASTPRRHRKHDRPMLNPDQLQPEFLERFQRQEEAALFTGKGAKSITLVER